MQTAKLETGAIVPLEDGKTCANCGCVEPSFMMIESECYCTECATVARANQIVHQGLGAIVASLVDKIPESEWQDLAWHINLGFGGQPCPKGINWHCEPID